MHEVLVNRLGGLSLPRKSVVRLTDRPDMTLDVYRGRKTTTQQQQQSVTKQSFVVICATQPILCNMNVYKIHVGHTFFLPRVSFLLSKYLIYYYMW